VPAAAGDTVSAFYEAVGGTLNTNTSGIGAGIVKALLKLATASSQRPRNLDKLRTALGGENLAFLKLDVADEARPCSHRGHRRRSTVMHLRP
jgi:NAD(P)-dependent dehydrogenase (short-subunit alcohol dehydrogenase family)